jgi:hypothetical protein
MRMTSKKDKNTFQPPKSPLLPRMVGDPGLPPLTSRARLISMPSTQGRGHTTVDHASVAPIPFERCENRPVVRRPGQLDRRSCRRLRLREHGRTTQNSFRIESGVSPHGLCTPHRRIGDQPRTLRLRKPVPSAQSPSQAPLHLATGTARQNWVGDRVTQPTHLRYTFPNVRHNPRSTQPRIRQKHQCLPFCEFCASWRLKIS